ncbi:MAG: alkaline phosphatase family protein [Acetobacteraceae bacterium]|nr:alkaline phosphatase family protein [Acetobacteraceae bacterium]
MRRLLPGLLATTAWGTAALAQPAETRPHNVILFVADGQRPGVVNETTAPAMASVLANGVRFANAHSLFPTLTTANASAMATGHMLGDTGDFGDTIYTAFPVPGAGSSMTPSLESDPALGEVDQHFAGNYLDEETTLAAARSQGFSTASIGALGPTLIFDHTARTGQETIIIDDLTGRPEGIPVNTEVKAALAKAGLGGQAPGRGDNAKPGNFATPGTEVANVGQQDWFTAVATKVVLPLFKSRGRPFAMVFWSRDPDGTQRNQGDSLGRLLPGISGKTSFAGIRNADNNLAALMRALRENGLDGETNVIVTSDHGSSTVSKESATSYAATQSYPDTVPHQLPPGFVAIDLAHALGLRLFDPDSEGAAIGPGQHPSRANGLIGDDAGHPSVVVAANGGSDAVYLPAGDQTLAARIVNALAEQDYTSGLFVDSRLGSYQGTLPLSAIALEGTAITPMPAIVVNFRSFSTGCADPTTCGVEVADTGLQQGQGTHGSFSRADTRAIMGAIGPDFRARFVDPAPVSNADIGRTVAAILRLSVADKGSLVGRVLSEAMPNGLVPPFRRSVQRSEADDAGRVTAAMVQTVGETRYFDAAGYPGSTLGLSAGIGPAGQIPGAEGTAEASRPD